MMKLGLSIAALTIATGTAHAQNPAAVVQTGIGNYGDPSATDVTLLPQGVTPTMQRQRLERATALREQVAQMLVADGGTLSPRNQRYVDREIRAIRGEVDVVAGSLIRR